jgi:hypothetical protein
MVARTHDLTWWEVGRAATSRHAFVKQADTPSVVHKLGGRLYLSRSGWLMLHVPNTLLRGAFDALHAPGAELPTRSDGTLNAHISIMRPEEVQQLGGPDKITERGHTLYYTLGPVKELTPLSWDDVSKAWIIEVDSPDLKNLRKSYGLSALPHDDHEFHITIGVRRKNVLRDNETAKSTVERARNDVGRLVVKSAFVANPVASPEWTAVPGSVREQLPIVAAVVKAARQSLSDCRAASPEATVLYDTTEKRAYLYGTDSHISRFTGLPWLAALPEDPSRFVCVKLAGIIGNAFTAANQAIGGPNALTNSIVGSLAGGTAGYLGGMAAEQLFPERYLEHGKLRRTLGLAGAGLGAVPPMWLAYAKYRNAQAAGNPSPVTSALTAPIPLATVKAGGLVDGVGDYRYAGFDTGGYIRPVPVDAFNRTVWNDVRQGSAAKNPFGTRSPWGEASDTMHTPPEIAAATTGLMSGISAMHGGAGLLHPSTIIKGLASAGAGLAAANIAGKTLSVLGGLTPSAQQQLQRTGVWAGVLSAVIPPLFH